MAFASAATVAVAGDKVGIALTHGLLGSHLGIAYCDEGGSARLMHLGWHRVFVVEPYPSSEKLWIATVMDTPPLRSSQLVALLRVMAERHADPSTGTPLGYGINLLAGAGAICEDGTYSPSEGCDGFTCASIVAEIFGGVGMRLVDLGTWVATDANRAWGRAIVCMLRATPVPEPHVEKVEANIGGLRLLPEEVAAAAELPAPDRPAAQVVVAERAVELTNEIKAMCGPPIDARGTRFEACASNYKSEIEMLPPNDVGSRLIAQAIRDDEPK